LSQIAYLQSDLVRMNQQMGDGEDPASKSNYGRSVEEAKVLIKQLEAFKNIPAKSTDNTTENNEEAVSEKNVKNDVSLYKLLACFFAKHLYPLDGYL
jgi:hypothetical protein